MDQSDASNPYPFKCESVIQTGHTDNIFNAQMLPYSTRLWAVVSAKGPFNREYAYLLNRATVARDTRVRVFDVERALSVSQSARESVFRKSDTFVREFRCHERRYAVKRIVTEESPDLFLTVGEVRTQNIFAFVKVFMILAICNV